MELSRTNIQNVTCGCSASANAPAASERGIYSASPHEPKGAPKSLQRGAV